MFQSDALEKEGGSAVVNLLEVEGMRTHIRMRHSTVEAVDGVSITVRPGETVGLVGESGCGKSVTGMSIMRLLPPGGRVVEGSVRFGGQDLTMLSDEDMRTVRGNEIAMVFQDPMTSLNPTMTIGQQIAEPVRIHRGASKRQAMERAAEVLSLVGMPSPLAQLQAFPHQLSGGMRQRVMIAMALACEPRLLIADEPTTALDVTIQAQILTLLDDLKSRLQMGMLLISHDMGVIAGRADRVMVMYAGRIVEVADGYSVFSKMRHPYTQALLESIPDLETDPSRELYSISGLPPDLAHAPSGCCRFAPRCRYVRERCRNEDPEMRVENDRHSYACFFPVEGRHDAPIGIDGPQDHTPAELRQDAGTLIRRPIDPSGEPAVGDPAVGHTRVMRNAPKYPAASPRAVAANLRERADGQADPLLILDHVVKEFPIRRGVLQRRIGSVKAVSDVSLVVREGETFGLVGESGCGKTTLGRLIVALESLDSGAIRFAGEDISKLGWRALRYRRRDLQLVFQDPYASLDPRMRIAAILREPLQAQGIGTRKEQQARIRQLLSEVGLPERVLKSYPHELSGGQRQRIGFARALILTPQLIVADEPVSALDVSIQSQILNLMKRLQAQRNLTYIFISHDLSVVRYLADRIGVMYLGKVVEVGRAEDVYQHPAHPYTAGLLQAIPVPDPERERAKGPSAAVKGELPSAANPPSGCRFRTRCPLAQDVCAALEPPMRAFGPLGHRAACHFPLEPPMPEGQEDDG